MLQLSYTRKLEAESKLLTELEARYHKAILSNEAFVLIKKLYLEIKQVKERLDYLTTTLAV